MDQVTVRACFTEDVETGDGITIRAGSVLDAPLEVAQEWFTAGVAVHVPITVEATAVYPPENAMRDHVRAGGNGECASRFKRRQPPSR